MINSLFSLFFISNPNQDEARRWNLSEGTMPGRSDIGEGYIVPGETEDSSSSSGSESDYSDDDEE